MLKRIIVAAAAMAALVLVPATQADPVRWYLQGVTFADGAAATGYFETDAAGEVTDFMIFTSAGQSPFTHRAYRPGNSNAQHPVVMNPPDAPANSYGFRYKTLDAQWEVRITPSSPLTAGGGTRSIVTGNYSYSLECSHLCYQHRYINGGSLRGITDLIFAADFEKH